MNRLLACLLSALSAPFVSPTLASAAEKGDKVSQCQIGLVFQTGQGVAADAEEAHRWFTMHRRHHLHYEQTPRMRTWRDQARVIIEERDRREGTPGGRRDGAQVVAEPKRRANIVESARIETAASAPTTVMRQGPADGPQPDCDNLSQWRLAFSCLKLNFCMTRLQ